MRFIQLVILIITSLIGQRFLINNSSMSYTYQSQSLEKSYYVSRLGNNQNGRSWETAWNELDQIDWDVIEPGDVIYLDGGSNQMEYDTNLEFGKSGQPNNPIRILVSDEANHNGQVIFFGGRSNLLPYCYQEDYDNIDSEQLLSYGIRTEDYDYIEIDGLNWSGIVIHGYGRSGIRIDRDSNNLTFKNIEIYNNGRAEYDEEEKNWTPDSAGVRLAGKNMTFRRVIIHDNGQDAFQSLFDKNNLSNFSLEQSWLYNGRKHPTVDESSNYCTHTDGIQIYDGGIISGVNITESVLGPGFTHNLILGQTITPSGAWAVVNDLFLQDVILAKAADNNLNGYSGTNMHNWVLDHVTIHCPKTKGHCIRVYNSDHSVTNSVFYGSRLTFPDGLNRFENNCIWQTTGFALGLNTDPDFLNVSDVDHFSLDDYTVQNPDCTGSRLTSIDQLLTLSD